MKFVKQDRGTLGRGRRQEDRNGGRVWGTCEPTTRAHTGYQPLLAHPEAPWRPTEESSPQHPLGPSDPRDLSPDLRKGYLVVKVEDLDLCSDAAGEVLLGGGVELAPVGEDLGEEEEFVPDLSRGWCGGAGEGPTQLFDEKGEGGGWPEASSAEEEVPKAVAELGEAADEFPAPAALFASGSGLLFGGSGLPCGDAPPDGSEPVLSGLGRCRSVGWGWGGACGGAGRPEPPLGVGGEFNALEGGKGSGGVVAFDDPNDSDEVWQGVLGDVGEVQGVLFSSWRGRG
mmetsp:Transcript_5890/g.17186  ORF Transcript_5890/g.17186 Transcript_5890/m.17186 type:complete len:285 (-) Transcript_5890:116-970(-)